MKKVYLLVGVLAATAISATAQMTTSDREGAPAEFARTFTGPNVENRPGIVTGDREAGDVVWSNNFDDGDDALWIVDGPVGDPIGWSIGDATTGWFFGTGDNMGTTGNFARFVNGDPTGGDIATWGDVYEGGPFTLTYDGTIDLTGIPAPHLEFDQYGALFQTNQLILVSTDDWATHDTVFNGMDHNDVLTDVGGSVFDQPQHIRINIAPFIAADPSNVSIQLYWDGGVNGGDPSYVEYAWFVDNLEIIEGFAYDSDVQAGYFKTAVGVSFAAGLQYYMVSTDQIPADGIQMSAETINQGGSTFTGLALTTEVTKGAASVFTCTSAGADVAPYALDSAFCTEAFVPADGTGTYDISWSFAGTETDGFPANDVFTDEFEVTDFRYSRSNGISTGAFSNWSGNAGQPCSIGNMMDIMNDGVIGAIEIGINNNATNVGELIYGQIMRWDEGSSDFIYLDQTPDHTITNAENGGNIVLVFEDPIDVAAGDLLLVLAGHYGGSDVGFTMTQSVVEGVSGYDAANTRFGLIDPNAIEVILHMRSYAGIDSETATNFFIGQNQPNPFNGNTLINYELGEASDVSVEFVDVSGKVVKVLNYGTQEAGDYTIELDGNEFAEGVYFYTFTVGTEKVTKRMIVTK